MASNKPHLSITLPRNFTFHYTDGQQPHTPEPQEAIQTPQPPGPPRQTYRIKRRRPAAPQHSGSLPDINPTSDVPIPTIETSDAPMQSSFRSSPGSEPVEGLLAPGRPFGRLLSPPKTPAHQIAALLSDFNAPEWENQEFNLQGEAISRPSTACSGLSDSSVSSFGSTGSLPSFGGSCTSPESDAADPFVFPPKEDLMVTSPLQGYDKPLQKRLKIRKNVTWTEDMDNHLWLTYMIYLQDPTVTPFKMLPGTAPPLGVCHRVARQAKKTWKGPRASYPEPGKVLSPTLRAGSPDTIKPNNSGESTPTGSEERKAHAKWPNSESVVRRRLRELCKRKPSLSAHYQRLLRVRSPSPFQSSSSSSQPRSGTGRLSSPFGNSENQSSFSRDMNISLATSTSTTMQMDNPLSQIAMEEVQPRARNERKIIHPSPQRAHQKSQSLQLELGLERGREPLAQNSLFTPSTSQPSGGHSGSTSGGMGAPPPIARLASPLEAHAARSFPRSFKRRAEQHMGRENDDSPRQNLFHDLFGSQTTDDLRRQRFRGFSLGAFGDSDRNQSERLSSLFTPPSTQLQPNSTPPADSTTSVHLLPPHPMEHTRRLGSPFSEHTANMHFNKTVPRNFAPQGLDSLASFEARLEEFESNR